MKWEVTMRCPVCGDTMVPLNQISNRTTYVVECVRCGTRQEAHIKPLEEAKS
jgi:uncharacterized Zn finger protein